MTTSFLTLAPYGKQSVNVRLLEDNEYSGIPEKIFEHSSENNTIFSDLSYKFFLKCSDVNTEIQDVRVYVNDIYVPSKFNSGQICFPERNESDKKIFLDCYGYVELSLTLILSDGTERNLHTEYLPVLVRKGQLNDSVKAMADYVYKYQELLLLNGEPKPRNITDLKENGYKSFESQIILAEEIAAIYESSYAFFKANSRFHIEKTAKIDRLEKLQYVTSSTLQYITSHPEQLMAVNSNVGVRVRNRIYQPQKTLSLQNVNSYDIYENRVILGFLRKMIDEVAEMQERCKVLLEQIPSDENYNSEYIYSSFFIFAETKRTLEKGVKRLSCLYDKFTNLWGMYRSALTIRIKQLVNKPRPTAVFMSVPQYNKIFVRIHQWFDFGVYDFAKEKFMLSFIKISSLYESYLLIKMIEYFKDHGYNLRKPNQSYIYPIRSGWKYKNTSCENTFYFSNNQHQVTLYYQPVIYNTDWSSVNGIGLYRNNSIPANTDDEKGAPYYTPDYLIKIENKNTAKYLIIDAKFSDSATVKKYDVKDLAFKYLFSVSPINATDIVMGMCIIYGKCTKHDQLKSAYDKQLSNSTIIPMADTLPMIEGVNTEYHYNNLDILFNKVLR